MDREEICKFIFDLIEEATGVCNIDGDAELLEGEVLDSLSIVYLVSELENEYEIEIPLVDVIGDNFHSVNCLTEYVENKMNE